MIPATTNGGGQCFAFPDVCKTPIGNSTPPIPYPNIGMCSDLKTSSCPDKIRICKKFAGVLGSEIPMSSGDEPGVAGGVVSGSNKKKVVYISGYPKVLLQGKVAAFLTSLATQNNANIVGAQIAPSQTKVLYSPVPVMGAGQSVSGSASSTVEALREMSQQEEPELKTIEIECIGSDGKPAADIPMRITTEQGSVFNIRSDADGKILIRDIPSGSFIGEIKQHEAQDWEQEQ